MRTRTYIALIFIAFIAVVPLAAYAGFSAAIVSIFGFFTGIAGWLLNTTIEYTILDIAKTIREGNLGIIIENMWKIVRDLVNLTLVFGLIYAGLQTILKGIDQSHVKELLKNIVICALLVNFSLIFTKVIIDVSNSASVAIYNKMVTENESAIFKGDNSWYNYGISGAFMQAMGLSTFFDAAGVNKEKANDEDGGFMYAVVGIIFMLIAAFVFFAGAIMLMTRFAVLLLLMIFSPILFAASAFKQTSEWRSWWVKSITDQAIFPPVYLFMLWISYKVVLSLFSGVKADGLSAIISSPEKVVDTATNSPILGFILGAILLVASLIAAKKAGAVGADMATRLAGRMAFGTMGALGRATAGRASYAISQNASLSTAKAQGGLRGILAGGVLAGARKGAASSYDVRATKIGSMMQKQGIQTGDAHSGGREAIRKEQIAEAKRNAEALGKVGDSDPLVLARKSTVHSEEDLLEETKREQKQKMDILNGEHKNLLKRKVEIPKIVELNDGKLREYQSTISDARALIKQKQDQKLQLQAAGAAEADILNKEYEIQNAEIVIAKAEKDIVATNQNTENLKVEEAELPQEVKKQNELIATTSKTHRHLVHEQSEKVSAAKEAVEREKNRNQIGRAATSFEAATAEYKQLEKQIHDAKASLEGERGYAHKLAHAQSKADQDVLIKNIKDTQKNIENIEAAQREYVRKAQGGTLWTGTSNGYADVASLEGHHPAIKAAYAYATGSDPATLKERGKNIRREWKTAAPEKKSKKSGGGASATPASAPAAHPPASGGGDGHH